MAFQSQQPPRGFNILKIIFYVASSLPFVFNLRNRNSLFISIRSSEELVRIVFELGYFTRGRLIKGRREAEQSIEQEGRRRLGDLKHWLDRNGLPPCKVLLKERPLMIRTINPYTMLLLARIFRRVTWRFQFQTLWWSHLRVLGNETIAELLTTNKLSELACLALYLMYEKKQGKKSVWYPYIRELDRQRGRGHLDVESPLLWSEAELEYLTGSPTKVLQLVYASLVIVLELDTVWFMAGSLFQQYPFDIPTEAFSFEIFKQAFAAVQSCVVHLQNVSLARRFALVPLGPPLLAYCSNCKAMLTAVDGAVQLRVDRPYKAGDPIVVWTKDWLLKGTENYPNKFFRFVWKRKRSCSRYASLPRLGYMSDPAEMQSVISSQGPVCSMSPCMERAVLDQLTDYFMRRLAGYPTTLKEDDALLADPSLNPRKRVATRLVRLEKKMLAACLVATVDLLNELPDTTISPCPAPYAPSLK
ncbi:hypothetical protein Bca52824_036977 [Brassica carinata]|uniref:Rubisco LSMT substrate-binding domain-containing protein n=1 Tax=Brassica carinata TaxID=52824 RepID=A0A8X7S892_BRACI|nr:hypothetical protein Bca52824_036977 [Brassica carinata]